MIRKLKEEYEQQMQNTERAIREFPWQDKESYTNWMAQTYFYSAHTTRIISLAGSLFNYDMNDFHLRFMDHAKGERNHEKVMTLDLRDFDRKVDDFTETSEARFLYQTQYYWIQNVHPISVYGYFLYLEGIAVKHGRFIYDQVNEAYSGKASRFLKLHIEEDVDHVREHFDILENLKSSELDLIKLNMTDCAKNYENLLRIANTEMGVSSKAA